MLLRQVARALGVGKERYYVGRDLEGNTFYERPSTEHPPEDWRHAKRTVEYVIARPLSDYGFESIPVQWSSWMRRTRRAPPTIEELEQDWLRQELLKEKVMKLEEAYRELRAITARAEESRSSNAVLPPWSQPEAPVQAEPQDDRAPGQEVLPLTPSLEAEKRETDDQREKARLRREFAKANIKPTGGNPDTNHQPEAWAAPPRTRP